MMTTKTQIGFFNSQPIWYTKTDFIHGVRMDFCTIGDNTEELPLQGLSKWAQYPKQLIIEKEILNKIRTQI